MRCLLEFPPILAFRDPLELDLILVLFGYLNYLTHGKVFHFYNNSPVSPGYTIQPLVMQGQALGTGTRVVWQHLSLHMWLTAAEFFTPILSLSAVWNLGCSFTVSRSASLLEPLRTFWGSTNDLSLGRCLGRWIYQESSDNQLEKMVYGDFDWLNMKLKIEQTMKADCSSMVKWNNQGTRISTAFRHFQLSQGLIGKAKPDWWTTITSIHWYGTSPTNIAFSFCHHINVISMTFFRPKTCTLE